MRPRVRALRAMRFNLVIEITDILELLSHCNSTLTPPHTLDPSSGT